MIGGIRLFSTAYEDSVGLGAQIGGLSEMFDIWPLGKGQFTYYLHAIADDQLDYYLGRGEANGYWLGGGAAALGLTGTITTRNADAFYAVMGGYHPHSWMALSREAKKRDYLDAMAPADRRAVLQADAAAYQRRGGTARGAPVFGFDMVLRPTKSVSLLHALGSPQVRDTVAQAHRDAVAAVMGYLERHCAVARRGAGGARTIASTGLICGCFEHRTSRCGDPLLHTHVVVANLLQGVDGQWGALDGRRIYQQSLTAGYLYQAELRRRLTDALGVEWTPVRRGTAEIVGFTRQQIRAFSQRREEIEAYMDLPEFRARFGRSAKAFQIATHWTRRAKKDPLPEHELLAAWRARAARLGCDDRTIERALGRTIYQPPTDHDLAQIRAQLAGPAGLTEQAANFTRREVLRGLCANLPNGALVSEVEHHTDAFLADPACAVPLAFSHTTDPSARRYSTPGLLATEQQIIDAALAARQSGCGLVDGVVVERVLAARGGGLNDEQQAMVRRVCGSGDGVQVVIGPAGTGKTRAMSAVRQVYLAGGYHLVGASLSGYAAKKLEDASGIPSFTIASLLRFLERGELVLDDRCVLVVDETGMVGTRQLGRIFAFAQSAGCKVLIVGDDKQLPEIDAGGGLRALRNRLDPTVLSHNVRQQQLPAWEHDAVALLRDGKVDQAMSQYDAHGRITVCDDAVALRRTLVADAWAAATNGMSGPPRLGGALVLAAERHEVDDLNGMFRALMDQRGYLGRQRLLTATGQQFAAGDLVLCLHTNYRLKVRNGTRGTIQHLSLHDRSVTVLTEDGLRVQLPAWYLDAGQLGYGYAMTVHKAQGATVECVLFLGSPSAFRELVYVVATRSTRLVRFYLVSSDEALRDLVHTPGARADPDPLGDFVEAAMRSHAKQFATDELDTLAAAARRMDQFDLRAEVDELRHGLADRPENLTAAVGSASGHYDQALAQQAEAAALLDRLQAARQASRSTVRSTILRPGRRRALDREIAQASHAHDAATRDVDRLAAELRGLRDQQGRLEAWAAAHSDDLARLGTFTHELADRERHDLDRLVAEQPAWLLSALGERPERPAARLAWRAMARDLRDYRQRYGVTDPDRALGAGRPTTLLQFAAQKDLAARLGRTRANLTRLAQAVPSQARSGDDAQVEMEMEMEMEVEMRALEAGRDG